VRRLAFLAAPSAETHPVINRVLYTREENVLFINYLRENIYILGIEWISMGLYLLASINNKINKTF